MLTHTDATKAINAIAAELVHREKAAVVVVADSYGELIGLLRVGDAPLSSIRIAMNKAWTAARERRPSSVVGEKSRDPKTGFDISYYGDERYVGWGGGIPLFRDGQAQGAIAVSGLSEAEDVELAQLGAASIAMS
jgi:glc operon protein GlcG